MKVTKSQPEVLKSDVSKDEWPRCEICGKFLRSGQKSYCCNECRLEDIRRNAIINRQMKKAKLEREREGKANRKRWTKAKEDREKRAERETKKTGTKIRRAKKAQKVNAQRPKKKRKRRGVKPILDELICPNCGSKKLTTQRPTPEEPAKKKTIEKPPVMDTLTKWPDIETQKDIIRYIASLISNRVISESERSDFFMMMSDALLRTNRIAVSPFILRHLTRMHIERDTVLAEDKQHPQEMPKDVREYLITKWIRALVFAKVRTHQKKRLVACPRCYKRHRWKGGQKEVSNEDRDKELISILKKGGGQQLWTHQRTDFGRALRSNEEADVWVLCNRCEKEKHLTPKDELRIATYRELAEEALSGKRGAPAGRTDRIVRSQLARMDGTIMCESCNQYLGYDYLDEYGYGYFDEYNIRQDSATVMVGETSLDRSILIKRSKTQCTVCRRKFYMPNGASGICEHCASRIYLERGMMSRSYDYDIYDLFEIYAVYKNQVEKGSMDDLCNRDIYDLFDVYNSYLEGEAIDNLFDHDIRDFFEVYEVCYHKREGVDGLCDCKLCGLEIYHEKKSLAFAVGLPTAHKRSKDEKELSLRLERKQERLLKQELLLAKIFPLEHWSDMVKRVLGKLSVPFHITRGQQRRERKRKMEEAIYGDANPT